MKRKAIGGGIYEELNGKGRPLKPRRYWLRYEINRHRTWKFLDGAASREDARKAGGEFQPDVNSFTASADLYVKRGCPTAEHGWQEGSTVFVENETRNCQRLKKFFGRNKIAELHNGMIPDYFDWRVHGVPEEERRTRQIDTETQTLSNVKAYILFITKSRETNNLKHDRPRYHKITKSPSRKRAPETADVIHAISEEFFNSASSEVFGWLNYFGMFTGCRKMELIPLRLDAKPGQPGHIKRHEAVQVPKHRAIHTSVGDLDLGRRLKQKDTNTDGVNPECYIWPEFAQMLDCFLYWHEQRFPDSPWYFPGAHGVAHLDRMSFNHAMNRILPRLKLPHITPHGLRSFFTTKMIRDGFRYEEVAEMIGDKTVGLLRDGYSRRSSGDLLSWLPSNGLPGWLRWQPAEKKIIALHSL